MLTFVLANLACLLMQNPNDGSGTPVDKGVIHEAFAQINQGAPPTDNLLVPRQPPEPLAEEPPDNKPDGDAVTWISGYWHYDDLRDDFVWVSGFWRQVPPGRKWVPGRFVRATMGNRWQWQAGYWGPADPVAAVVVPDMPPPIPEAGPSVPAPAANMFWSPGFQTWRGNRWAWRAGCWMTNRPGWVWYPSSWCWTPRGYVFLPGYWDYALEYRGLLYAPVYYRPSVWQARGFCHRPRYVVCHDDLACGLFRRNGCGNYYYGDYFGVQLAGVGFSFWIGGGNPMVGRIDPLAGYYHRHRDAAWVRGVEQYGFQRGRGNLVPPPANIVLAENKTLVSVVNNTTIHNTNTVNNINRNGGKESQSPARKETVRLVQAGNISKLDLKTSHGVPPREVDHAVVDDLKKDGRGRVGGKMDGTGPGNVGQPPKLRQENGLIREGGAAGPSREPGARKGLPNGGAREVMGKDGPSNPTNPVGAGGGKKDGKGDVGSPKANPGKGDGKKGQEVNIPTPREAKGNPTVEAPKGPARPAEPVKEMEPRQRPARNTEPGKVGGGRQESQVPAVLRGGVEPRGPGRPGGLTQPGGGNSTAPQVGAVMNPGRGGGNGGARGGMTGSVGTEARKAPGRTNKEVGKSGGGGGGNPGRSGNR